MPLPTDVGEAVAAYLRRGRPASSEGRALFIRVKAPHRALTSGGVTQVVAAAAKRAGLGRVYAHRLRHTAATQMLRAGSTLPEIGQVLRHRRALTTAIYAKTDRVAKNAVVVRPATLFKIHEALTKRKYRRLFSSVRQERPGPKGPSQALIDAIVEMKTRNPRFGCPRIAQQLAKVFGIEIDKDVVRRVLPKYYRAVPTGGGPSWLTVIGHMKDSLWSVDLFRCESILMKTHWVINRPIYR